MKTIRILLTLLIPGIFVISACGGSDATPTPEPTRGFTLGFTPWPYDATSEAVDFVYDEITANGDIVAHHLDSGIPWQEALDETAYPAAVEAELTTRQNRTPADKRVYLAVSPFNVGRDNLALYWGTAANQPLPPAWAARDFDSPEVVSAYTNFAKNLINRFNPDYFNLGIEASELAINDLSRYDRYVTFAAQVSTALKTEFPDLKLMISIGLKSPGSTNANIINTNLPRLIQHIDVVGASVYPFVFFDHTDKGNPDNLPTNWLSQLHTLANGKPIAVAETGWIAERLEIPSFGVDVMADANDQNTYLDRLFAEANALEAEFVVWFFMVDFDALWNNALGQDDVARIWRDTGLYDQNLVARPALTTWQNQLDRKHVTRSP